MDLLQISQNIRNIRQSQKMTVEQLAAKSGFSKGFISQVENFRVTPSLKALDKIAVALGLSLGDLFQENGPCGSGSVISRWLTVRSGGRSIPLLSNIPRPAKNAIS